MLPRRVGEGEESKREEGRGTTCLDHPDPEQRSGRRQGSRGGGGGTCWRNRRRVGHARAWARCGLGTVGGVDESCAAGDHSIMYRYYQAPPPHTRVPAPPRPHARGKGYFEGARSGGDPSHLSGRTPVLMRGHWDSAADQRRREEEREGSCLCPVQCTVCCTQVTCVWGPARPALAHHHLHQHHHYHHHHLPCTLHHTPEPA
ncbi:hypothetical protein E2C01_052631 [Portunus trituberculatus]|uniref:Uncharacterized protein n=1 Tax=Portunus trituberculatus TaxID=210409 RepID=A0A5B7GPW9_PORTR|nr:hypothetical protein [Portunus trituberculatus]